MRKWERKDEEEGEKLEDEGDEAEKEEEEEIEREEGGGGSISPHLELSARVGGAKRHHESAAVSGGSITHEKRGEMRQFLKEDSDSKEVRVESREFN